MVFRREGTCAKVTILVVLVVVALLFAVPAWSQQGQQEEGWSAHTRERDPKEQRDRIEGLSQEQTEDELVQAARTSNAAGDLEGKEATAEGDPVKEIIIEDAEDCGVDEDASITFQEVGDDGDVSMVFNGEGSIMDLERKRIIVTGDPEGAPIEFAGKELQQGKLEVISSSVVDCDGDNDDGFDDELLLLLLLELLEDAGNNANGSNDRDDNNGSLDGNDEDVVLDTEEDLEVFIEETIGKETTDGDISGDDFDDGQAVSAASYGDGAALWVYALAGVGCALLLGAGLIRRLS